MNARILGLLALSVLSASCGTTKLSTGDLADFNSGKKAILQTNNQPLLGAAVFGEQPVTQIIAVDGRKLPSQMLKLDEKIAIDVGPHKVELSCVNRRVQDARDYTQVLQLDLKPHHEYRIRCSFNTDFGPNGTYTGSFSVEEKRVK